MRRWFSFKPVHRRPGEKVLPQLLAVIGRPLNVGMAVDHSQAGIAVQLDSHAVLRILGNCKPSVATISRITSLTPPPNVLTMP